MNSLISVLIPAYNVENYIEEAVLSILGQTYNNIEVIIIDDCSSDTTKNICERLEKEDQRIKFFVNSHNAGIAFTLNRALEIASGEYILRMDSDDISLPNRIEVLLKCLIEEDVDIVGSSTITIDEEGNEIGHYYPLEKHIDIIRTLKYASPLLHIWMCKKSLYEIVGNYRQPPVEDYDFLLRCIKAGAKLGNVNESLYKVRLRNGNTADLYGYKQLRAFELVYKSFINNTQLDICNNDNYFSNIQQYLYVISRKILMKGSYRLKRKKKVSAVIFFIISGLMSTYQCRYLIRRISLFLYKKKNKL